MKIEKIFVEGGEVIQNSEADPFEVSDAETMLKYLKGRLWVGAVHHQATSAHLLKKTSRYLHYSEI